MSAYPFGQLAQDNLKNGNNQAVEASGDRDDPYAIVLIP